MRLLVDLTIQSQVWRFVAVGFLVHLKFEGAILLLTGIALGELIVGLSQIYQDSLTFFYLPSDLNALQKILVHQLPDHGLIFAEAISHSLEQISNKDSYVILLMNGNFVRIVIHDTMQDIRRILPFLVGHQHPSIELPQLVDENLRLLEFDLILVIQVLVLGDLQEVVIFSLVVQNLRLDIWQEEEGLKYRVGITRISDIGQA